MKGGRKHRETGGVNEAEADEDTKPKRYTESNVDDEAEERARGGRTRGATVLDHGGTRGLAAMKRRKRGGRTEVGKVEGERGTHHAGRKPRRSGGQTKADREHEREGEERYEEREHRATGGRTARARGGSTSDANPFTSARKGEDAPGRKVMKGELGFGED